MTSTQGAHGPGRYYMRTGYTERASITHPTTGGWINKIKENRNPTMPGFVTVNCGNGHPGAGFFEPKHNPLPIGNVASGQDFTVSQTVRGEVTDDNKNTKSD